jgi:hypothetical protein
MTMSALSRPNARPNGVNAERNSQIAERVLSRVRRRILKEIQKNRKEESRCFDLRGVTDSVENFKLALRNPGGGAFRELWIVAERLSSVFRRSLFADGRTVQRSNNEERRHR